MDDEVEPTREEKAVLAALERIDHAKDVYAWRVKRYLADGGSAVRLAKVLGKSRSAVYQTADRAPATDPAPKRKKRAKRATSEASRTSNGTSARPSSSPS